MKKITLIIITVITFMANYSNAQENKTDFRERFLFGLKAGFNRSNVYDTQGEAFLANPRFGIAAGAFLAIPIGKYMGIQPELLFSQKGFQATGRVLGSTYNFTRTTSYIDMPILFSVKPSEFITLHIGPQYSYLIRQKDVFANAATTIEQEQEFEDANVRRNILGITGGIDINLKHIVLGTRVGCDVLNNNEDRTSSTPRYKNVWFQATIGYRFYNK